MKFSIKDIKTKNFKSRKGEFSFSFENLNPGLHQIYGENGSGKSDLLESIFWVLFGRTTTGLKAGDVHSWFTKGGTYGCVNITINDTEYCVERQWNPNKLLLNGEKVDQTQLETTIKFNADSFQHSVYLAQFTKMFFDLDPSVKLSLISSVLDLDYWMDCSKKATNVSQTLTREKVDKEKLIRYDEGQLDQLVETGEEYELKMDTFDQDKDKKINELQQEQENNIETIEKITEEIEEKTNKNKELEKKIKDLSTKEKEETDIFNSIYDSEYVPVEKDVEEILREMDIIKAELKKFSQLDDICPSCEQKVSKAHVKKHLKECDVTLANIKEKKEKAEKQLNQLQEKLESINSVVESVHQQKADLQRKIDSSNMNIGAQKAKQEELIKVIDSMEKTLNQIKEEKNPYAEMLDSLVEEAENLDKKITDMGKQVNTLDQEIVACDYWTKNFKQLRLYVVEDILNHLEVQVNNHIHDMGLENWSVEFDVEKQNKDGGISKQFHILIESPESEGSVKWAAWSGGEKQRLRVSGTLGLSDLIFQSYGIESDIMFLDEPTQHLSKEGIDNLLELLDKKAKEEGKQIWFIDHHTYDYAFETTTEIIK